MNDSDFVWMRYKNKPTVPNIRECAKQLYWQDRNVSLEEIKFWFVQGCEEKIVKTLEAECSKNLELANRIKDSLLREPTCDHATFAILMETDQYLRDITSLLQASRVNMISLKNKHIPFKPVNSITYHD
jgi:hypothetical protein